MSDPLALRALSQDEAAALPALLARAEHLAGAVLLGAHGRRRAGAGDDFWQYRPAQIGDSRRAIDYRRSAMGDTEFVREREWQIAQSVMMWVDQGASMRFASSDAVPQKIDRARALALAVAILLNRGGERVGLTGTALPPRAGRPQIMAMAQMFCHDDVADYAPPEHRGMIPHARAVFISDFMGDIGGVRTALTNAADRGVRGVLCHVLDPSEEAFPFTGRTIFQSMGGTLSHETLKASDLRDRYLARLAERKAELQSLCALTGWRYGIHHTDSTAQAGLLWLYGALDAKAVAA